MESSQLGALALISLLAAISPGPDFAIVTKNCLSGNFRTGILTACGVCSAILIHVTYCIFGIAIVIRESPIVFHILQYSGAAYLLYLGVMLLREKASSKLPVGVENRHEGSPHKVRRSKNRPFLSGFLCNLLNPKATLFILSIFTQFLRPEMGIMSKALMGVVVAGVGLIWFTILSYLLTHHMLRRHFTRFQFAIMKTMGIALCLLAIYVVVFSSLH